MKAVVVISALKGILNISNCWLCSGFCEKLSEREFQVERDLEMKLDIMVATAT